MNGTDTVLAGEIIWLERKFVSEVCEVVIWRAHQLGINWKLQHQLGRRLICASASLPRLGTPSKCSPGWFPLDRSRWVAHSHCYDTICGLLHNRLAIVTVFLASSRPPINFHPHRNNAADFLTIQNIIRTCVTSTFSLTQIFLQLISIQTPKTEKKHTFFFCCQFLKYHFQVKGKKHIWNDESKQMKQFQAWNCNLYLIQDR